MLEEKIKKVIEEEINPMLQIHAGGCEFKGLEADGTVLLKMYGGCSGCPSSQITLFNMITPILKEKLPEITDVILS